MIIHYLPEPKGQSTSACITQDIKTFKEIVNHELKADMTYLEITKAVRLGKVTSRPCILLVSLRDEQRKITILRSVSKLKSSSKWSDLYIFADLTPRERVINCNLPAKLKQCRNGGEKFVHKKRS